MKSLIVCVAGVMAVSVVLGYGSAYAASISLSKRPGNINVLSGGGVGVATLGIVSSDFPSGKSGGLKKLLGIEWTTTSYPQNTDEQVQLCYYRPYNTSQQTCEWIRPNSFGNTPKFNDQRFGNGAGVIIYHKVSGGGARIGYPSGNDSVVFHYAD